MVVNVRLRCHVILGGDVMSNHDLRTSRRVLGACVCLLMCSVLFEYNARDHGCELTITVKCGLMRRLMLCGDACAFPAVLFSLTIQGGGTMVVGEG